MALPRRPRIQTDGTAYTEILEVGQLQHHFPSYKWINVLDLLPVCIGSRPSIRETEIHSRRELQCFWIVIAGGDFVLRCVVIQP
jgi:hypothetical protein